SPAPLNHTPAGAPACQSALSPGRSVYVLVGSRFSRGAGANDRQASPALRCAPANAPVSQNHTGPLPANRGRSAHPREAARGKCLVSDKRDPKAVAGGKTGQAIDLPAP